jgi:Tfp pilus assembly protein PilV
MTLVELMISVAILALGISAVLGLNIATMNASAGAANLSRATLLAETQSEWLRTMDYNKVAFVSQSPEKLTANGLTCAEDPDTPCIFTRTTTILTGAPTSTSSTISIKVEWQNKELIYDTVVSSIGFF